MLAQKIVYSDAGGIKIYRHIKDNAEKITILILQRVTASGGLHSIKTVEIGEDNYVVEPIQPDQLIDNIKILLQR